MNTISPVTKRPFKWTVFWVGLTLYVIATIAGMPLVLTMQPLGKGEPGLSSIRLALVQLLLVGILSLGVGLYLTERTGLRIPFIEGWVKRKPTPNRFSTTFGISLLIGVIGSPAMLILSLFITVLTVALKIITPDALLEAGSWAQSYPAPWKWFLVSINAAITEEITFRLGLMTLIAWLGSLISHDHNGRPTATVLWIANILAALVFGVAHLWGIIPVEMEAVFIIRTIIQGCILGSVFGWLYWKRGLESAVLAHFFFDIVTYVVLLPVLQSNNLLLIVCALVGLIWVTAFTWRRLVRSRDEVGKTKILETGI